MFQSGGNFLFLVYCVCNVMLKLCVSGTIYILYIKIYKYVNIKYT